ncbi:MAG: porin, partial [Sphingobacteriales bacterium]
MMFFNIPTVAQEHTLEDTATVHNLKEVFTKGRAEGHVRNFFMATSNKGSLSDYYANATGARLGYTTARVKGFRIGFAGIFTYNTFSSNLQEPDSLSGKLPKYELELFDVEHPENQHDLDRLEELYLEYKNRQLTAMVGRFSFQSPLINPQDGRMKPYAVQGAKITIPVKKTGIVTLAWLSRFSPRSTVNWYSTSEAIGIYTTGVSADGIASEYGHQTQTKGVAVAGAQFAPSEKLEGEVWNYWLHNISNTTYNRAIWKPRKGIKLGGEALYQQQSGNGGNPDPALAYFPDQQQWLVGGMLAYEPQKWHFSANYLHIAGHGRFLFPREFGREQFFTTVSRGRLEGVGNAKAFTLRMRRNWASQFSAELALTKTWLPGASNYQFNKYSAVSYVNTLLDIQYRPTAKVLEGLSLRLLY